MNKLTNQDNIRSWSTFSREMIDAFGDEGDPMRRYILNPVLFELLGDAANRTVLDAGCGNGYLCRWLAKQGAQVTGIEPASSFFAYAKVIEPTLTKEGAAVLGENSHNMHVPNFIIISALKH